MQYITKETEGYDLRAGLMCDKALKQRRYSLINVYEYNCTTQVRVPLRVVAVAGSTCGGPAGARVRYKRVVQGCKILYSTLR